MALHFMQHTKAPLSFTPSAAHLTALSRGHVCASPTYRFTSSSSSFLSRVLRKLSAPFPSLQHHGQRSRVRSPVSFFKFGTAPEKIKLPDVVEAGDPVLHEPASPVPVHDICSHRIQKIIDDMVAVMRAAPGVGLAAPQIGISLQIIVLEDTQEYISYASKQESDSQHRTPFDLLVICNPSLKSKENKKALFFEGCLSIAGYNGLVERHLEVEVTGYGRDGLPLKVEAYGWKARILQHECDHLNGVLYVDKLIPRTFRTDTNSRFPLAARCPKPGVCRGRVRPGNLAIED